MLQQQKGQQWIPYPELLLEIELGWSWLTLENIQRQYRLLLQLNYIIVHSKYFPNSDCRVVTWYMGSGLKAQNLTGIRVQRRGLRAQKNGIRDHKAFKPESGIVDKVSAHIISWPRYITYSCFRFAAVPVIRSLGCLTKTWYHILNLLIV